MFKHILFPTDGEAPSPQALAQCLTFARDSGARLLARLLGSETQKVLPHSHVPVLVLR